MDGVSVPAAEIFKMVRRIVFLSVPQWGTNIADWVRSYKAGRMAVVAELRASVAASQLPLLDRVQDYALRGANCLTGSNLGLALQDALSEAEARLWRRPVPHRGCARSGIRARSLAASHGVGFSRHRRSGFAGAAGHLP